MVQDVSISLLHVQLDSVVYYWNLPLLYCFSFRLEDGNMEPGSPKTLADYDPNTQNVQKNAGFNKAAQNVASDI